MDVKIRSGDGSLIYCFLLQQLSVIIPLQYLHLLNGYLIEFNESFTLRHAVIDENGIDVLFFKNPTTTDDR